MDELIRDGALIIPMLLVVVGVAGVLALARNAVHPLNIPGLRHVTLHHVHLGIVHHVLAVVVQGLVGVVLLAASLGAIGLDEIAVALDFGFVFLLDLFLLDVLAQLSQRLGGFRLDLEIAETVSLNVLRLWGYVLLGNDFLFHDNVYDHKLFFHKHVL